MRLRYRRFTFIGILYCFCFAALAWSTDAVVGSEAEDSGSELVTVYECHNESEDGTNEDGGNLVREQATIRVDDPGLRFEFHSHFTKYFFRYEKSLKPTVCSKKNIVQTVEVPVRLEVETGAKQHVLISNVSFAVRKIALLPTGQLQLRYQNISLFYRPHEYCIRRLNSSHTEFEMCSSHCENSDPNSSENPIAKDSADKEDEICIQKCCAPGHTITFHFRKNQQTLNANSGTGSTNNEFQVDAVRTAPETPTCQPSGDKRWKPIFWNAEKLREKNILEEVDVESEPQYKVVWNRNPKECMETRVHSEINLQYGGKNQQPYSWLLLNNGSLILNPSDGSFKASLATKKSGSSSNIVDAGPNWKVLDHPFCLDGIHDFAEELVSGLQYAGHEEQSHQLAHVCYDELKTNQTTPPSRSK